MGMLIYAVGDDEPVTHVVVHLGKSLEMVALELNAHPEAILRQIRGLAERIAPYIARPTPAPRQPLGTQSRSGDSAVPSAAMGAQ